MKSLAPNQIEADRLIFRNSKHKAWQDLHAYYPDEETTQYTLKKTSLTLKHVKSPSF